MVTFILMPTFAISAFLVGVLPAAYAAPLSNNPRDSVALVNRGCRQAGCLIATSDSSTSTATSAAAAVATGSPASNETADTVEDSPDPIGAVARAVGAARPYAGVLTAVADEEPSANQI